jgi:hypothetical protein
MVKQALQRQCRSSVNMIGTINKILNGGFFKCILSLFSRDYYSPGNIQTPNSTEGMRTPNGTNAQCESTDDTSSPSEVDLPFSITSGEQIHHKPVSEDIANFEHEHVDDNLSNLNELPLTARYMKMFTYLGDYDETSTALALPAMFIWQFNRVYQCEDQISQIRGNIRALEQNKAEFESMVVDLNGLLENPQVQEEREALTQDLQEALETIQKYEMEIGTLVEKLEYWTEKKLWPHDQIFSQMKEVLQRYNLLDEKGETSEHEMDEQHMMNDIEMEAPSQTPSELAKQELHMEREAAADLVREARFRLQDAEHKVDNWKDYCDRQYREFEATQSQRAYDTTKTEFDGLMLLEAQEATRELIQAEETLEETIKHAREFGLVFEDFDQESCFPDHIDDGYRESWEAHETAHVDRGWIESWMRAEKPEYPSESDDWDFREVDLCDSVSLVAEGKERKRIDRWRVMCGLNERE